jgi:hypothetical protein
MTARPRAAGVILSVVVIALGVILLLNNLGIVHWAVWRRILEWWPAVLVLGGAWLLFRHVKGE